MNDDKLQATQETKELIAVLYVFEARAQLSEKFERLETSRMSLESLIDNVNDHNELMLSAIESVSPELSESLEACMSNDDAYAYELWTTFMNELFELARAVASDR